MSIEPARDNHQISKKAAFSGLLAVTPLIVLGAADQAAAERIVVKNTNAHGKGSFHNAVKRANRDEDKDKILFVSKLSGTIDTPGEGFNEAVEVKSNSDRVRLVGTGSKDAHLRFRRERTRTNPGKRSAIRGLTLDGVDIRGASYVAFNVTDMIHPVTASGVGISALLLRGGQRQALHDRQLQHRHPHLRRCRPARRGHADRRQPDRDQ